MKKSEDTRSFSFRGPVIAAAVIVAVYATYVVIQYGRLNDRNQRELASAAAELGRSIDNALQTARNFAEPKTENENKEGMGWCAFDRDQPYLKLDKPCDLLKDEKPTPDGVKLSDDKTIAITVDTLNHKTVSFRYLTGALLGELSFPESFQSVFVAGDNGAVLYQDAPAERQWLRWLRWGDREFRDSAADKPADIRIENLKDTLSGDKDIEWNRIRSHSGRIPLSLGESYQAYLQPVPLSTPGPTPLILGGAVPTMHLVRQALAMDTYFISLTTVLLMLGLFGYPFIKLRALDERERFGKSDVFLLYWSSGALLALLTFTVFAWDGYAHWSTEADKGLQTLAKDLSQHFKKEVSGLRDQLVKYDEQVATSSEPQQNCPAGVYLDWFSNQGSPIRQPGDDHHFYIEQVSWISPDGNQKLKITADKIGRLLKTDQIAQRPYYRAVRDKNLFNFNDAEAAFFIAPDRSITDGKFKTFMSIPSRMDAGACGNSVKGKYVVAAVVKLLSLDRVPLPAGYGFAVFNREGRVLYHSDARVSLRENIFDQTDIGPTLKSRVFAGQGSLDPVDGSYHEHPHRLVVQPLGIQRDSPPGPVLYLAVFRDVSVEHAIVSHAFVTSLSVTMLVLGIVLLLGSLFWQTIKRHRLDEWLWPHGGLTGFHQLLCSGFLIQLFLGTLLVYRTGEPALILVIPFAAAGAGIVICRLRKWRLVRHKPIGTRLWQAGEVVLLSLCLVIVPSATLFRLTLSYEFGKLIVTERKWVAEQLADMELAAAADGRADDYPDSLVGQRIKARNAYINVCPEPFNRHAGDLCAESGQSDSTPWSYHLMAAHDWLQGHLPVDNDALYRSHFENSVYVPMGMIGIRGLLGFVAIIGILVWWIRWNTNGLFYAELKRADKTIPLQSPEECETVWQELLSNEKLLLIQVAEENVANPRQKALVKDLIKRGLLKLAPSLQPASRAFRSFLLQRKANMKEQLLESQKVAVRSSWRYVRLILITALVGLGLFLAATQPGWQSTVLGVATGVTGLLTTLLKLQDVVTQWFKPRS